MDLDAAKENIQPLASGRDPKCLEVALSATSTQSLLEHRQEFEDAIKQYSGSDPLEPWFQYILWLEQIYPSGGKESGLEEVLIKCLQTFDSDERYFQDRRMIKLYIKYIDSQQNPQEFYEDLYNNGIGTMIADLYICWAYYYDLCGNFKKADNIFRRGLSARAQPYDELEQAHQHFGFTMSQRLLYQDEDSQKQFISSLQERRHALTSLRHKKKVGSIRTGAAVKSSNPGRVKVDTQKPCTSSNIAVQVFEDENHCPNSDQLLNSEESMNETAKSNSVVKHIIDSARKQENIREPGPWSKAKLNDHKSRSVLSTSEKSLAFEILEDNSNEAVPLLPLEPNNYKKGIQLSTNHVSRNNPQSIWKVPVCAETEIPSNVLPVYNKFFAYPKPDQVYSREEYMAYKWFKSRQKSTRFTEHLDNVLGEDYSIGIRLYPNFCSNNKPQPEFNVEKYLPDECLDSDKVKMAVKLSEIYPINIREEFSPEELLHKQIVFGKRKIKMDLNSTILLPEEMDETKIIIDNFGRKSILPSRKSIMERKSVYIHPMLDAINSVRPPSPTTPPDDALPTCGKNVEDNTSASTKIDNKDIFKMPFPSVKPTKFEIYEEDFESERNKGTFPSNNDTCTQSFNFHIKAQSVSTPVRKGAPEPNEQTPAVLAALDPVVSPELENHQPNTLQPKQLSTIMETTESNTVSSATTGSTKSIDTQISSPEFDNENSKQCTTLKTAAFSFPKTIVEENEEASVKFDGKNSKNTLGFIQKDDTIPSMMKSMKLFEETTETVPKNMLFKETCSPNDIVRIFTKTPENRKACFKIGNLETNNSFDRHKNHLSESLKQKLFEEKIEKPDIKEISSDEENSLQLQVKKLTLSEPFDEKESFSMARQSNFRSLGAIKKEKILNNSISLPMFDNSNCETQKTDDISIKEPLIRRSVQESNRKLNIQDRLGNGQSEVPLNQSIIASTSKPTQMLSCEDKRYRFSQSRRKSSQNLINLSTVVNKPDILEEFGALPEFPVNMSQIQEKSFHIKEEIHDENFIPNPTTLNKSVFSRFSIISKRQSIVHDVSLKQNESQMENLKKYQNKAESFSQCPESRPTYAIEDDPRNGMDENLHRSIYVRKYAEEPVQQLHRWTDKSSDEDSDTEEFPHLDINLDISRRIIDVHLVNQNLNPFEKELRTAFLEQIEFYSYIQKLPNCEFATKIPLLKVNRSLKICHTTFDILKFVGEGGFGTVFCASERSSGMLYALKQEKPPNFWEYYICLELRSRLSSNMLAGFMDVDFTLINKRFSIFASRFSKYGSLIHVANKVKSVTTRNIDELIVMVLANQMLSILDHLHASNIIHADIKPDNFLLMTKLSFENQLPSVQLIDFGESIDLASFPQGQIFYYNKVSTENKCIEMIENRPWTFQIDLFGLAGTIHVLLFGTYMEVEKKLTGWTHKSRIPRYFNKEIWLVIFNELLNIRDCKLMPNLQRLRTILEEEIVSKEKLVMEKMMIFNAVIEQK